MPKWIAPNNGKTVRKMREIMADTALQALSTMHLLAELSRHIKSSPTPRKPTGIAKARRQARRRRVKLKTQRRA